MGQCEHRIWGLADGLICNRVDPHSPGRGCVYWGSTGAYHLDHTVGLDFQFPKAKRSMDTLPVLETET